MYPDTHWIGDPVGPEIDFNMAMQEKFYVPAKN
jgi:hypothetical protein